MQFDGTYSTGRTTVRTVLRMRAKHSTVHPGGRPPTVMTFTVGSTIRCVLTVQYCTVLCMRAKHGTYVQAVPWMGHGHSCLRMGLSPNKPGYAYINPGIPYRTIVTTVRKDSLYGIASWSSQYTVQPGFRRPTATTFGVGSKYQFVLTVPYCRVVCMRAKYSQGPTPDLVTPAHRRTTRLALGT